MLYLIGYDIKTTSKEGTRRLSKVAKVCCNYGQRVQNSLFECELNGAHYVQVKNQLLSILNAEEYSLRIYCLGKKYNNKIEEYGAKTSYDPLGDLIV